MNIRQARKVRARAHETYDIDTPRGWTINQRTFDRMHRRMMVLLNLRRRLGQERPMSYEMPF